MSFFEPLSVPVKKIKGSLSAAHYRLRVSLIAGKLVSTRARFLFRLTAEYYKL